MKTVTSLISFISGAIFVLSPILSVMLQSGMAFAFLTVGSFIVFTVAIVYSYRYDFAAKSWKPYELESPDIGDGGG